MNKFNEYKEYIMTHSALDSREKIKNLIFIDPELFVKLGEDEQVSERLNDFCEELNIKTSKINYFQFILNLFLK